MERPEDLARRYRFATTWTAEGSLEGAFDVLEAVPAYTRWWPAIRRVTDVDDDSATVHVRSVLPYTLRLRLHREITDRERGVLQVRFEGDLEGRARWSVEPAPDGFVRLRFDEVADIRADHLARVEALGQPLYELNHRVMMARGERGFRAAVAGYAVARDPRNDPAADEGAR
jgi:hypothetical protein